MAGFRHFSSVVVASACIAAAMAGCWSAPDEELTEQTKQIKTIQSLAKKESDEAVDRVMEFTNAPDRMTARTAVWALGQMKSPRATKKLEDVAKRHPEGEIRFEAVTALSFKTPDEARPVLRQVVERDPDPNVRGAAAAAFGQVGTLDDVEFLSKALAGDESVVVQSRAVAAVERLVGVRFRFDPTAPAEVRREVINRLRHYAPLIAEKQKHKRKVAQNRSPP